MKDIFFKSIFQTLFGFSSFLILQCNKVVSKVFECMFFFFNFKHLPFHPLCLDCQYIYQLVSDHSANICDPIFFWSNSCLVYPDDRQMFVNFENDGSSTDPRQGWNLMDDFSLLFVLLKKPSSSRRAELIYYNLAWNRWLCGRVVLTSRVAVNRQLLMILDVRRVGAQGNEAVTLHLLF